MIWKANVTTKSYIYVNQLSPYIGILYLKEQFSTGSDSEIIVKHHGNSLCSKLNKNERFQTLLNNLPPGDNTFEK